MVTAKNLADPWFDLQDDDKIQTLLGCAPPATWNLRRSQELEWLEYMETHISSNTNTLLQIGTKYKQDLRAYYSSNIL